jgi:hypothetical protein
MRGMGATGRHNVAAAALDADDCEGRRLDFKERTGRGRSDDRHGKTM